MNLLLGLLLFLHAPTAAAKCDDSRVKALYELGRTMASIAKTCDLDKDEVEAIIDDVDDEPSGAPKGTPVGQCGCWGFADPSHRQPHSQCASGYAQPQMCPAQCPMGGYAWRGVCT